MLEFAKIMLEFVYFAPETPSVGLNFADSMPNIGEIMPVTTDFMPNIPYVGLNFAYFMPDIGIRELTLGILEQNYCRFLPETRRA
jgi:predicted fused transcriptional regulator/phosphomethylpyrimidine kinase